MGALSLRPPYIQKNQKIIHIDMDCFFAAVEERDNPSLKGKPVAVGGSPSGRGVLCTANYEARKYGVRSAMSSAEALRRCPDLVFIRPRSRRYSEISHQVRKIFEEVTPLIQPLSLDEAYLDVTKTELFHGSATLIAKYLKEKIYETTGLTASAGVAPNLFLAKIASDWKKPNGLFVIKPEEALEFAKDLPLGKVPGIGKVSEEKCHKLGLKTLGDLHHYPVTWLETHFGKQAYSLHMKSFGIDNRVVETENIRKSLGHEETYSQDLLKFSDIEDRLPFLWEELEERFQRHCDKRGPTSAAKLFIKMKTNQFKNHTLERMLKNLDVEVSSYQDLKKNRAFLLDTCRGMFEELYQRIEQHPLRLLGLGLRLPASTSLELEKLGQLRLL